ncbi:hypothetical protein [Sigmofec virus UA08Rod_7382]|uniref:Uncharacterized protein n=1 Tax=Sigmofec virus UA08Rod_7382 TaxID=2929246 RepID=A0A976N1E5_9VIRU|nr:hypothetical protein [Sigmofec virus UA08Rod_7382]
MKKTDKVINIMGLLMTLLPILIDFFEKMTDKEVEYEKI